MLKYLFLLLLIPFFVFSTEEPILVINAPNVDHLPRSFRTSQDQFHSETPFSRQGLDTLLISGSAQFSELELKAALKKIAYRGPLAIVDLRQESHGFLNGIAISWFLAANEANKDKNSTEIKQDQQNRLAALRLLKEVVLTKVLKETPQEDIDAFSTLKVNVQSVADEETLANENGADYFRIYVPDHHAPSDDQVDAFIVYVINLKPKTWLHFHCQAGKGRTTTFMCMYDMMRNAKQLSFEEIIDRQDALIPGHHFRVLRLKSPDSSDYDSIKQRGEFLRLFYQYAKNDTDGFKTTWQVYKAKKNSPSDK